MKRVQRKESQTAEVRIPFPKLLSFILVFVAVVGVSYLGLCAKCDKLGNEIKALETAHQAARQRVINEQDRWSNLLTPTNFERALAQHGLSMAMPESHRVVRVRGNGSFGPTSTLAYQN